MDKLPAKEFAEDVERILRAKAKRVAHNGVKRSKLLEQLRRRFRWRSADGTTWTIYDMLSPHMLNCAKMLYNEVAAELSLPPVYKTPNGLQSRWMTVERKVEVILMLWDELRVRGDLAGKDVMIFEALERQLFELCLREQKLGMQNYRAKLMLD